MISLYLKVKKRLGFGIGRDVVVRAFERFDNSCQTSIDQIKNELLHIPRIDGGDGFVKGQPDLSKIISDYSSKALSSIELHGVVSSSVRELKDLAALSVGDSRTFGLYRSSLLFLHADSLSSVRKVMKKWVVLHMTCRSRLSRAKASFESFSSHPDITHIFVVGGGVDSQTSFDDTTCILTVSAGDSYECLPKKMVQAYSFLSLCPVVEAVLKVDDDHRLVNFNRLIKAFQTVGNSRVAQFGNVIRSGFVGSHSRVWHMGKCSDPIINNSPCQTFNAEAWCDGAGGYFINSLGLSAIFWSDLYFSKYIDISLYEDSLVSECITKLGFKIAGLRMNKIVIATSDY